MLVGIDASKANKKNKTGTEWYSYHLIQELKKLNTKSDQFILYSKEALKVELAEMPDNWHNKILFWPPQKLWTQLRFSWEMVADKPDILFVPAHTIPLIHPRKTVTTLHDVGFERYPEIYSKKELAYHRFSARLAVKQARHIITISEFSKKEIIHFYGADPNKISVVYNGFNKNVYKPLSSDVVDSVLNKHDMPQPYILFVGRLEKKKNVLGLIKSFNLLLKHYPDLAKNLNLVLVGCPGFGYEKIKTEIIKNNLQKRVLEIGWVDEKDLAALYSGAKVFSFLSFYEGFGIPVIEAMACGTPVVASKVASLPEIVGNAGLLVNPSDYKEISEQMAVILQNESLQKDLIAKGRQRAQMFSWEKCAKETWDVIKSI